MLAMNNKYPFLWLWRQC